MLGPLALTSDLPLLLAAPPLHESTFSPLIGKVFRLARGAAQVDARLISLLPQAPAKSRGEAFKLVFQAVSGPALSQDTYTVTNSRFGQVELFLVPATSGRGFQRYEALVNRLP